VATAWVLPVLFTSSTEVRELLPLSLVVLGLSTPLAGLVFVLDGVLIGAGDARYLAWTGLVNLAVYAPIAFAVVWWATGGADAAGPAGDAAAPVAASVTLAVVTGAFVVAYLAARAVTLSLRARGQAWMVTGAPA
jgi:Na+-driven multidrug efflux pump